MTSPEGSPERPAHSLSTTRIEAFSDGVFAIATTLLVLEVVVPHVGRRGDLFAALLELWPSYLSYLVSFLTIGVMWLNHHFLLSMFARVDRTLLLLNLGLLAVIAFVPFPTGVLAEYLVDGTRSQLFAAAALYGVTLILVTVMFLLLWVHVLRSSANLEDPAAAHPIARRALVFSAVAGGAYLLAVAISALVPQLSIVLFAAVTGLFAVGRLAR